LARPTKAELAARKANIEQLRARFNRAIRAVLQATRKDRKLNQEELAAVLCWSRSKLAKLENGTNELKAADLFVIAQTLKIDPELMARRIGRWD
jgi:transcriptional regulator with XRE-family HTH domain